MHDNETQSDLSRVDCAVTELWHKKLTHYYKATMSVPQQHLQLEECDRFPLDRPKLLWLEIFVTSEIT
ncbi:hypothetical protein Bhyg_15402 [Pseudolycoriella hygida]|uniref:Uncharacterized protein n=1 Tax=Pseudolycoriella hygida TaxID=35572 RepID=A0A9Q0RY14_9DIPT|nr:hypothetical protein Bhyg_15402 [Pseudolycoriella hygida]